MILLSGGGFAFVFYMGFIPELLKDSFEKLWVYIEIPFYIVYGLVAITIFGSIIYIYRDDVETGLREIVTFFMSIVNWQISAYFGI